MRLRMREFKVFNIISSLEYNKFNWYQLVPVVIFNLRMRRRILVWECSLDIDRIFLYSSSGPGVYTR